jgi:hypothetical protein
MASRKGRSPNAEKPRLSTTKHTNYTKYTCRKNFQLLVNKEEA